MFNKFADRRISEHEDFSDESPVSRTKITGIHLDAGYFFVP